MLNEYWQRIHKLPVTPLLLTVKIALLLTAMVMSTLKGIFDLSENKANRAKLMQEKEFYVSSSLTAEQIAEKKTSLASEVKKLNDSLGKTFAIIDSSTIEETKKKIEEFEQQAKVNNPPSSAIESELKNEKILLLRLKTQKLIFKVNTIAVDTFTQLDKQRVMLKTLDNGGKPVAQEKLDDVKTLLAMNDRQFIVHQMKVFDVREENLVMGRKRTYRGIAFDISKVAVFTLILAKAPLFSLVPINFTKLCKQGIETISLASGILGVRKFAFDSYNKLKDEPRPIIAA